MSTQVFIIFLYDLIIFVIYFQGFTYWYLSSYCSLQHSWTLFLYATLGHNFMFVVPEVVTVDRSHSYQATSLIMLESRSFSRVYVCMLKQWFWLYFGSWFAIQLWQLFGWENFTSVLSDMILCKGPLPLLWMNCNKFLLFLM